VVVRPADRQIKAELDRVENGKCGQPLDARLVEEQAVNQLAALRHASRNQDDNVVPLAGHVIALLHLWARQESGVQRSVSVGGLRLQGDEDDGKERTADVGIEERNLTPNHACRVVASDAPVDCTGRQADGLAELAQRAAGIVLKQIQQVEIYLVQGDAARPVHARILRIHGSNFNRRRLRRG